MILLGIVIIMSIASIAFAIITMWRLKHVYVKKFPLPESKYTLLFRHFSIQHFMFIYMAMIVFLGFASVILTYLTLS